MNTSQPADLIVRGDRQIGADRQPAGTAPVSCGLPAPARCRAPSRRCGPSERRPARLRSRSSRRRTCRRRRSRAPSRFGRRRPARRGRESRPCARAARRRSVRSRADRARSRRRVRPLTSSATAPCSGIGRVAVERVDVAADHHADDRVDVGLGDRARADEAPVAKHGVAVADAEHLLEPVGDENDRNDPRTSAFG